MEQIENNKFNINISIDPCKCMSRKNKTTGLFTQCPFNKKFGDYCGKHSNETNKNKWCLRVDSAVSDSQIKNYFKSLKVKKRQLK